MLLPLKICFVSAAEWQCPALDSSHQAARISSRLDSLPVPCKRPSDYVSDASRRFSPNRLRERLNGHEDIAAIYPVLQNCVSTPISRTPNRSRHLKDLSLADKATPVVTAVEMGARQREISVSEFFTKNRHLLGFDNPRKALLTCVKEAVDNSLDACEEAGILPDVTVKLETVVGRDSQLRQARRPGSGSRSPTTDPASSAQQIPRIFAKLLYGSKFHRMRMSRGQQGIGISAAGMYGQLTTGKPVKVISRTGPRATAHYFEVQIDTKKNEPLVHENKQIEWDPAARHRGGDRSRRPVPEGPRLGG